MRLSVCVGVLAVAVSACDRLERVDQRPSNLPAEARMQQVKEACASKLTYARLQEYVFDQAASLQTTDPRWLDSVAAQSVVRMEDPVVKSRDEALDIVVCTGRFVLNLPPGIQDAFNGKPIIEADVEYAAQTALDGSGLVYSMNGAEPIIYRLATIGLRGQQGVPRIATTRAARGVEDQLALAEGIAQAPAASRATEAERAVEPRAAAAPRSSADKASPTKQVAARKRKTPPPQPVSSAKSDASPSFNCKHARSRSEKMVCGNGSLAAADRRMSAVFYDEMASADRSTKRALRQTRAKFLAKRERCSSQACVARVYQERVAEIRRISQQ
jgi:hypothetical protein